MKKRTLRRGRRPGSHAGSGGATDQANGVAVAAFRRNLMKGAGAGGRKTQPYNYNPFAGAPYAFVPRRLLSGLDMTQFSARDMAPWQLLQILADSHVDVGMALWNVLRLGTADFEYSCKVLTKADDEADNSDPIGQAFADRIVAGLNAKSGGVDSLMVQWMQSWYLQGAVCGELALTDDLRTVMDIYPVNPWMIFFRRDAATQELVMYQQQLYHPTAHGPGASNSVASNAVGAGRKSSADDTAGYRLLNDVLCMYIPCDPGIDDPYGRIPAASALNEVFFDINLMADLQKIVHGVAVPRYWVKVVEEVLKNSCPDAIKNNPDKYSAWLNDRLGDVQKMFEDLETDDAFVAYDSVMIDIVTAKTASNTLGMITALMKILEKRIIKALKMLPILMANNEGTTETHGSVQYEIFAQGIRSAQAAISAMFCRFLKIAIEIEFGHICQVEGKFRDIKTANRYVDAGSENREIVNELIKYAAGWQTNNDASMKIVGEKAISDPLPGVVTALTPHLVSTGADSAPSARGVTLPQLGTEDQGTEDERREDEDA